MNYALNTPIRRQLHIPKDESLKIQQPKHTTETDQTHRFMTWLFHRPADHVILPDPHSARMEKKK